ncbi:MAG: hypothetical protein GY866_11155 [Proteobacteria bacterium]|nr:hypothetical protein [Pseudomonadota bacterium]
MKKVDISKDPIIMDMRGSIDRFDVSFLHLLAERSEVVNKIMVVKLRRKIDLGQSDARKEDMKKLIEMSVQLKLEKIFFRKILNLVFQDAMEHFIPPKNDDEIAQMSTICSGLALEDLRNSLLNLDKSLCLILAERFRIVKRIGQYKKHLGIPPLDPVRWQQVLDNKAQVARTLGINVSLVTDIFNAIHELSLTIEDKIMGSDSADG